VVGGGLCLFTAVILVVLDPTVWVDTLGNAQAIFPYKYPALFSMTVAFIGIWLFSITDCSASAATEHAAFDAQYLRSQTELVAGTASTSISGA